MSNNPFSVKSICEFIWSLEKKHDLMNKKINDVYVWPLIRLKVYYEITNKVNIFNAPHPNIKKTLFSKINTFILSFAYFIIYKFSKNRKIQSLIIPHPRKINGSDIYSQKIQDELKNQHIKIDTYLHTNKNTYSFDFVKIWAYVRSKTPYYRLDKVCPDFLNWTVKIENELEQYFGIKISILNFCLYEYYKFKYLFKEYDNLIIKRNIKNIFLVVSYSNYALIASAKKNKIPVFEFQHGTISQYHLGYSFPNDDLKQYAPDYILYFGEHWLDCAPYPTSIKKYVVGSPTVAFYKTFKKTKKPKSIVFSSQGVIGKELFNIALESAKSLPDYTLFFNIHPSENPEVYQNNEALKKIDNLFIIYNKPNIFKLLSQAEYQAGVFSTTLYEGICLDTKPILVKLPGYEYMQHFAQNNNLSFVTDSNQLIDSLKKSKKITDSSFYYSHPSKNILQQLQINF